MSGKHSGLSLLNIWEYLKKLCPYILIHLNGQGKQTCINYLADILDFKVENLIISPDKKVEDSLGHTIITKDNIGNLKIIFNETQLAKELKYGNQGKKPTLFVIHNIFMIRVTIMYDHFTIIFQRR